MKKSLLLFAGLLSLIGNSQIGPGFTVTNTYGSYAITCATPTLNFTANSNNNLTYVWTGPSSSQTGSNVNISIPGNYTVVGTDTANTSTNSIFTVVMNTFVPNSSISPTLANITCTMTSSVSFTANTNTSNCTHQFLSPFGGTVFSQNATAQYNPSGPGTYTLVTIDNSNGCSSTKQFTITSANNYPGYSIVSPQNFTLGCASKSIAVINIVNAQTTPTPGGAVSFTLLPPGFSGGWFPGPPNTFSVSIPGTWTVIVKDNSNGCETKTPISVIQNTTSPTLSVNVPKQVLDCYTPQVTLKAKSSTPNVYYIWMFSGTPSGSDIFDTFVVHINTAAPNSTLINTFTTVVTDNNNACKNASIIPMYQNIFKPNALLSSGGNFTLNASTPSIVLVNISTTGIPPALYPTNMPVIGYIICGPSPQFSLMNSSTFTATLPGTYTLTAKDLNNGCTSTVSITMIDGLNLVSVPKIYSEKLKTEMYPNPNNGQFTLRTDGPLENTSIKIYNMLGVQVKKEDIYSNQQTIDIENESKGIYIVQILENNKIIYTSKIIKE